MSNRSRKNHPEAIGLGSFCLTSEVAKGLGLRMNSMPFDWIFSNPLMVEHAIKDDFVQFLDPANYATVPVELRLEPNHFLCDHTFYKREFGAKFVFNHHNPATSDKDREYFRRCVARFRAARASTDMKLFVLMQLTLDADDHSRFETYRRLRQLVAPHALLCVQIHKLGQANPVSHLIEREDRFAIINFGSKSRCLGTAFEAEGDFEALSEVVRTQGLDLLSSRLPEKKSLWPRWKPAFLSSLSQTRT